MNKCRGSSVLPGNFLRILGGVAVMGELVQISRGPEIEPFTLSPATEQSNHYATGTQLPNKN